MAKYSQKEIIKLHKETEGKFNCYSFYPDTKKRDRAVIHAELVDALMFAVNEGQKGNLVLFLSEEGENVATDYEFKNHCKRVGYDLCKPYALKLYNTGLKNY